MHPQRDRRFTPHRPHLERRARILHLLFKSCHNVKHVRIGKVAASCLSCITIRGSSCIVIEKGEPSHQQRHHLKAN